MIEPRNFDENWWPEEKEEKPKDSINPDYYNHPSGIKCIDIAKYHDFCIGNAFKYLWRAGLKKEPGKTDIEKEIEDLEKALWYIQTKINLLKCLK